MYDRRSMLRFAVLTSAPIALMQFVGSLTDAEMMQGLAEAEAALQAERARAKRLVCLTDLTDAAPLNAHQRKLMAKWGKDTASLMCDVSVGVVVVTPSAVMRGVATALSWLFTPPVPHAFVGSLDEAASWGVARCDELAVPVPSALRTKRGAALRDFLGISALRTDTHAG